MYLNNIYLVYFKEVNSLFWHTGLWCALPTCISKTQTLTLGCSPVYEQSLIVFMCMYMYIYIYIYTLLCFTVTLVP